LDVDGGQRRELERMIIASTKPQCMGARARIVLLPRRRSPPASNGRGPKASISDAKKEKIIIQATQPPPHRTRSLSFATASFGTRFFLRMPEIDGLGSTGWPMLQPR
jgi:hypothetical protein